MKRNRTPATAALLAALALALCLLGACGGGPDPRLLVQGNLDTLYRNSPSQEYLDAISNPQDAAASYAQRLESEARYFADYFAIDLDRCAGDTLDRIQALYGEIYAHAKYEVGEATRSGDGYLVRVTLYPMDIIQQVLADDFDAFSADCQDKIHAGYFDGMADGEFETWWAQGVIDLVAARTGSIGYLEPETISVQLTRGDDGCSVIADSDLQRMDALILQY